MIEKEGELKVVVNYLYKYRNMIILRNKEFSEYKKQPYYSMGQRLKNTATGFGFGAGVGAGMGAMAGGLIGGRTGAKVGATLGGLALGSGLARLGWKDTSKESVDKRNALALKRAKEEEMYKKNPRLRYKDLEDPNLEKGFRDIENQYNVKYGDDFYKYLKLRKKLVPILVDLEKKGTPVTDRYGILMSVNPNSSKNWVNEESRVNPEELSSMLAINPEMADDTWLTYNFKTGKYGYDPHDNSYPDLKSLLLNKLKQDEDYIRNYVSPEKNKGDLEFINKYRNLIKREL